MRSALHTSEHWRPLLRGLWHGSLLAQGDLLLSHTPPIFLRPSLTVSPSHPLPRMPFWDSPPIVSNLLEASLGFPSFPSPFRLAGAAALDVFRDFRASGPPFPKGLQTRLVSSLSASLFPPDFDPLLLKRFSKLAPNETPPQRSADFELEG